MRSRSGERAESADWGACRHRLERRLAVGGFLVGMALGGLLGGFSVPDQRRLGSGEDDPRRPTADLRTLPRTRWAHGGVVSHRPAVSEVGR